MSENPTSWGQSGKRNAEGLPAPRRPVDPGVVGDDHGEGGVALLEAVIVRERQGWV